MNKIINKLQTLFECINKYPKCHKYFKPVMSARRSVNSAELKTNSKIQLFPARINSPGKL